MIKQPINKSLHDSDITIQRIRERLDTIADSILNCNRKNLTDINIICEEIFGEILNRVYNLSLVYTAGEVSPYFVAIDLLDIERKIAFQVSSRRDNKKITETIKKFEENELYNEVRDLRFLFLNACNHSINDDTKDYSVTILNLKQLADDIEQKSKGDESLLVDIYSLISMVYDSGRLRYDSVVKETEELMKNGLCSDGYIESWTKGYGDIGLHAIIPCSYQSELCCLLLIRQYNISGVYITLNQEELLRDYFVDENEFEQKHYKGSHDNDNEMLVQIGNVRMNMNANTAYHMFRLFEELSERYNEVQAKIDSTLGTKGLKRIGCKYLLIEVSKKEWEEILIYARTHNWFTTEGEIKWNIFNVVDDNSVLLLPNAGIESEGNIYAKVSAEISEDKPGVYNLYWEPGVCTRRKVMECFDNEIMWKADYTRDWIEQELIEKASSFCASMNRPKLWSLFGR